MDLDVVMVRAGRLLAEFDDSRNLSALARMLPEGSIRAMPQTLGGQLVCVDGAVATEQTDVLIWIAAVAATNLSEDVSASVQAGAAMPVAPDADRVRGALMALCEVTCAVDIADRYGLAWMDGGIATPLLSIAAGLLVRDESTVDIVTQQLDQADAEAVVARYVNAASAGRIAALPKQDTATGFAHGWADQLSDSDPRLSGWVRHRRDRLLAASLLDPGQFVQPRSADEALTVTAKTPNSASDTAKAWTRILDELYQVWRDEVSAYVTYVVPPGLPDKPIKIEYTVSADGDADEVAAARVATVVGDTLGPRMREPYAQYTADEICKREVTGLVDQLMQAAQREFGTSHPQAVQHYRT